MKRCEFCQHGLHETDSEGGQFVTCTLIPPQAVAIVEGGKMKIVWPRVAMSPNGWCGQFKLAVMKYLFRRGP